MRVGEQAAPRKPILVGEQGLEAKQGEPNVATIGPAYTGGAALIDALQDLGVEFIFANFGSDHPAVVEGIAGARYVFKAVRHALRHERMTDEEESQVHARVQL